MKPVPGHDPIRWRERDVDAHALESRAAALAEAAGQATSLGPEAASRIRIQVLARRSKRGLAAWDRLPLRVQLALGIGLVLVCVTTAGGASVLWRKYLTAAGRAVPPPVQQMSPPIRRRSARSSSPPASDQGEGEPAVAAAPVLVPPAPKPTEGGGPMRVAARGPLRLDARPSGAVATTEPAPVEPPPPEAAPDRAPMTRATESGLVAEALSDLRQRNDPHAALATLDRYVQQFPHGVLETEALRTRAEAVIRLGDRKTALALLEGQPALSDALGVDLLLTRAELRAAAGRFGEALSDFNQILNGAAGPVSAGGDERALYGRAVCLGHLGQDENARMDLLAYRTRFPRGRFTVEVERLLAGRVPLPHP
jgi:hypothetical protein